MTSKANAFADLLKQAKGQGVAESEKPAAPVETTAKAVTTKRQGKREHSDYGKIGVYIRSETITEVKSRLIRERKDLSDLVQELLDKWLTSKQ